MSVAKNSTDHLVDSGEADDVRFARDDRLILCSLISFDWEDIAVSGTDEDAEVDVEYT